MRLPRLPVSRRRHEETERELRAEFDFERQARAKLEREMMQDLGEARLRVVELDAAIRNYRETVRKWDHTEGDAEELFAVLDGHDRQERDQIYEPDRYLIRGIEEADGDH